MSDQVSFEPEVEFDPAIAAEVEGLIHLGEVYDDVEYAGHSFGLRTLTVGEEIAAAKVIQNFRDTIKEPEAFATAQVALALTHVDGDEEFCPQAGPSKEAFAKARFNYVASNWYWPTIEALFQEYVRLKEKQIEAIRKVQDLSRGSLPISWPSEDSFKTPGTSSEQISSELP